MTESGQDRPCVLVIGYGNPLRGDDGLGPYIVDLLAADRPANVETLTPLQLLPELAASLAEAEVAIFVDARMGGQEVELILLQEKEEAEWSSHTADPRALLALTRAVFGRAPRAWWVTVPGVDLGLGEGLSPLARQNAQKARKSIETLLCTHPTVRTARDQPPRSGRTRTGVGKSSTGGGEHPFC